MLIIPAIDLKDGQVVRLKKGDFNTVQQVADDPVATPMRFRAWRSALQDTPPAAMMEHLTSSRRNFSRAKEGPVCMPSVSMSVKMMFWITASSEGRALFTDILRETAARVFIPLTVGGGINTLDDFQRVLECGADKVSVNSGAIRDPSIIPRGSFQLRDGHLAEVEDGSGQAGVHLGQGLEEGDEILYAPESLEISMREGRTCFWSRSRRELWRKGETSGNVQPALQQGVQPLDREGLPLPILKDPVVEAGVGPQMAGGASRHCGGRAEQKSAHPGLYEPGEPGDQPCRYPLGGQCPFQLRDGHLAEVEDGSGQAGVHLGQGLEAL